MRDTRNTSPFSAKTRQEQLEQWICWQNQHPGATLNQWLPDEKQDTEQIAPAPTKEPAAPPVQTPYRPRHSQYDAVVNRMRNARRQAAKDQNWSG